MLPAGVEQLKSWFSCRLPGLAIFEVSEALEGT